MMRREGLVRREGRLCGGWPTDHMRLLQDQRAFKGGKDHMRRHVWRLV